MADIYDKMIIKLSELREMDEKQEIRQKQVGNLRKRS